MRFGVPFCRAYFLFSPAIPLSVRVSQPFTLLNFAFHTLESLKSDYNLLFFPATTGRCILSQQSDTLGYVEECSEQFYDEFINLLDKDNDIVVTFGRYNTWISKKGEIESKCEDCDYIDVIENRFSTISRNSKHLIIIK